MAQLRITFTDGKELTGEVTPLIEYLFEQHYKIGFHKAFRDLEQQTMVYWLAHEITKRSGEAVDAKFENFIATLKSV